MAFTNKEACAPGLPSSDANVNTGWTYPRALRSPKILGGARRRIAALVGLAVWTSVACGGQGAPAADSCAAPACFGQSPGLAEGSGFATLPTPAVGPISTPVSWPTPALPTSGTGPKPTATSKSGPNVHATPEARRPDGVPATSAAHLSGNATATPTPGDGKKNQGNGTRVVPIDHANGGPTNFEIQRAQGVIQEIIEECEEQRAGGKGGHAIVSAVSFNNIVLAYAKHVVVGADDSTVSVGWSPGSPVEGWSFSISSSGGVVIVDCNSVQKQQ